MAALASSINSPPDSVLISYSPVGEAWRVGGFGMAISLFLLISLVIVVYYINKLEYITARVIS